MVPPKNLVERALGEQLDILTSMTVNRDAMKKVKIRIVQIFKFLNFAAYLGLILFYLKKCDQSSNETLFTLYALVMYLGQFYFPHLVTILVSAGEIGNCKHSLFG